MKRVFSLFLVCCIFGQASVRTLWVAHYQWNRAVYLARCENRSNPDLHCDGKCYLKKRMEAKSDDDPKEPLLPESFRQLKDIQLFMEEAPVFSLVGESAPCNLLFPPYRPFLPQPPNSGIFRPPAA